MSLVPDVPGELAINSEVLRTFEQNIIGQHATIIPALTGARFDRASVERRRLLAHSAQDGPWVKRGSLELHTDGSGVFCVEVPNMAEGMPTVTASPGTWPRWIQDEGLVIAVVSGLLLLAQHARDRAAAGGSALIRAQIFPINRDRPTLLAQTRPRGIPSLLSERAVTRPPPPAEAAAALDDLAKAGPPLVAASALLVDEIGQAFGVPEMPQLSGDGQLRRRY